MNQFPHLFSPIKIGETTIKNRVFMPPISTNLAENGYVSDALVEHYKARAKGAKTGRGRAHARKEPDEDRPSFFYLFVSKPRAS